MKLIIRGSRPAFIIAVSSSTIISKPGYNLGRREENLQGDEGIGYVEFSSGVLSKVKILFPTLRRRRRSSSSVLRKSRRFARFTSKGQSSIFLNVLEQSACVCVCICVCFPFKAICDDKPERFELECFKCFLVSERSGSLFCSMMTLNL